MSAGDHDIAIGEVCRQVSPLSDRATLTGVPTPRDHVNVLPPLVQPGCLITANTERQQGNSIFALFVQRDSPELGRDQAVPDRTARGMTPSAASFARLAGPVRTATNPGSDRARHRGEVANAARLETG